MSLGTGEKRQILEGVLDRGVAKIALDPRRGGVRAPGKFMQDSSLVLNLSYRFAPRDLKIGDLGISQTLSFDGERFPCFVPWEALFAIEDGEDLHLFANDAPPELLVKEEAVKITPPHLQLVK